MTNKGTILYFGNFEMPDKDASAHRVLNNSKILRNMGYKVVFCGVFKSEIYQNSILGFDNRPRPYPKSKNEWVKDLCCFSYYKDRFDEYKNVVAIIVYDFHALPLIWLLRYCKKRKIRVIGDITEWYENKFSLNFVNLIKFFDTNIVMRVLFKHLDGMIVISKFLEKYYNKHVSTIINIPPLVDIDENNWEECFKHGSTTKPSFVYCGTTDKAKDKLDIIVNSLYKNYKLDYKFSIYGITVNEFLKMYPEKREIVKKLHNKLSFYGRVSHAESIKALFNNSCSLIIREATRKNNAGFPTKFVEALTSGIDIISTNISDISEYKGYGRIVVINQITQKAIDNAITHYITDYRARKRNGLSDVFDYRRWEKKFSLLF